MNYKFAKLLDNNNSLNGRWYVYYYYRHPETGQFKRFRKGVSSKLKTKTARRKKADEYIKAINLRLKRGWNPFIDEDIQLTNVTAAIEYAMNLKARTIKQRSEWTYRSVVKHFVAYLKKEGIDKLTIEEINSRIVQKYFDNMLMNEPISKRTYNNRLTPLKTLFELLRKREYIGHNPMLAIDKLRCDEPAISAYTSNELELIRKTLPKHNYELYVITQLIYYCFLRPAEIVRLQYKDILYDASIIVIPGTKSKNKKSQVITIPDHFKLNLKDWDLKQPANHYIFSTNLKPGTREVAPTRIASRWRDYANAVGIGKNIYDFKHTGNGNAFDQGFNARDIQLQNRHSSLDETQKYLNKFRRIPSDRFKEFYNGY